MHPGKELCVITREHAFIGNDILPFLYAQYRCLDDAFHEEALRHSTREPDGKRKGSDVEISERQHRAEREQPWRSDAG